MPTNWYVLDGAPASGKTSTLAELARRGYHTTEEAAREYFDAELAKGRTIAEIRANKLEVQKAILNRKCAKESAFNPNETIFLDRGIPDTLAYSRAQGLPVWPELEDALAHSSYKKVFLLDPLPLTPDTVRTETPEEQHQIHEALKAAYEGRFPVVSVPVLPVRERADYILERL